MSIAKKMIIIALTIIVMILLGLQQYKSKETTFNLLYNLTEPTYQSKEMVTLTYDPMGKLSYKLVASMVKHYAELKETWFILPEVTLYDKEVIPNWMIKADRAKLTNNHQLYLYGNIQVNNLEMSPQIKQILADNAHIDLMTQNISSDSIVTLIGPTMTSTGLKMTGNLRDKTANLIENVKTQFLPKK